MLSRRKTFRFLTAPFLGVFFTMFPARRSKIVKGWVLGEDDR